MGHEFSANEILEMAELIERNGTQLYLQAAEKASGDKKSLLLELSIMQSKHEMSFAAIRKTLTDDDRCSTTFDPTNETAAYLKNLAESSVCFKSDLHALSFAEIIHSAICTKHESTIFFLTMKDFVGCQSGLEKIDALIHENIKYLKLLNEKLTASTQTTHSQGFASSYGRNTGPKAALL